MPIVLCTACGTHGAQKAINLVSTCPAAGVGKNCKSDVFRKQARRAQRGIHPSKPTMKLHGMRRIDVPASTADVGEERREGEGRGCKRAAVPEVAEDNPEQCRDEGREAMQALAALEGAAAVAAARDCTHELMDEETLLSDIEL